MKITIKEAITAKQRKDFILYPVRLFKNNPYFVPPLYSDEMKALKHKSAYDEVCDTIYFLAYDEDNKIVGRIAGIIQKQYNERKNEKRVRFDRFDCVDNQEVANALFKAVEDWGKSKGMDTICGPLGFSDMEREGLLIEGFDQESTFEEQYHAPYYQNLIANLGFVKEVDWLEYIMFPPKEYNEKIERIADLSLRMNGLHIKPIRRNMMKYVDDIKDDFFDLIDKCYGKLYGVVPFTKATKKAMVTQFKLLIQPKFARCILDENNKMVACAFVIPSIGEPLKKSGGRLTPLTIIKILHLSKHPKVIDFGLIGVDPEYQGKGVNTWFLSEGLKLMKSNKIHHFNSNLNLETNTQIQAMWKHFDAKQNKRRRAYVKSL